MNTRCYLPALGIINALGSDKTTVGNRLFAGDTSGMVLEDGWMPAAQAQVGRVAASLPEIPETFSFYRCRNNRLLLAALSQIETEVADAISRYGPARIGVVLGTSTSGMIEGEAAIATLNSSGALPNEFDYRQQEIGMPSVFLARYLELAGPAYTISTACTSSAKAFSSARNLLRLGFCDAVLVGGVDSLCRLTINGFAALESTTTELTNPMSRNRHGINIGEGAALFLMTREITDALVPKSVPIELLGIGESSDAHHISAPDPEGRGAESAMRKALLEAGVIAGDVDYLNLHATATPKNDAMESFAVARVFPEGVAASGTKPLTGHTLGAAGATELAFCWLALTAGKLPPHIWDGEADPALPCLDLIDAGRTFAHSTQRICMSNSFAFGGSNASLLVGDMR